MPAPSEVHPSPAAKGAASLLSDELRLTLLLFLFSFFISGVPRVYTQTAAHALFIEAYGSAALPWAYLAEALCVPLAGYLYLLAERRLSLGRLMVATLGSQIVALLLFHQGVAAGVPLVAGASIVYFEIEFVLSSLLLWGLANQLMTLRQGKRLFGFVSAGEPVAIIVCGLSTPLLLRWLSPNDLFLLSALGAAVGIVLVLHILRHHPPLNPPSDDENSAAEQAPHRRWWHDPYVRVLVLLVVVGQMAYFFVDNAFYVELDKRYPDEHAMASFLGLYSAVMGAISLVCSVLLAPWLLRRFGVRGGLLVLPMLLLLGALATVLVGGLGGPAELLFWLVVGNKVIDQSFRYTLDKTTFVTLFQPLPARQRLRVQAGLEGMVEPLSGGFAGLLLFALIQGLGVGAVGITAVILCVACVWAGLVAVQYRGYLQSLRQALAGRRMGGGSLRLDDPQTRQWLRQGLRSARAGEVLYSLSLLDSLDEPLVLDDWAHLLRHAAPEVRLEAARRLEAHPRGAAVEVLRQALEVEPDEAVRSAMVVALGAQGDFALPLLSGWLTGDDTRLAQGAQVGLLRHGGIEGALLAGPFLLADLRSDRPERRAHAAQVMGQVGSAQFYRPLLGLLDDTDTQVARAALTAAGVVAAPPLWPAMVQALARPDLQRTAVAALARLGDAVLPALESVWQGQAAEQLPTQVRLAQVDLCRRLATPAGDQRLLGLLRDSARSVRERSLRALWQRRHLADAAHHAWMDEQLLHEVARAGAALDVWRALDEALQGPSRERALAVRRVLEEDVAAAVSACFMWLGLRMHSFDVHQASAHYAKGGPQRRAYVVEMLDNALPATLKRPLIDLMEPEGVADQAARRPSLVAAGADTPSPPAAWLQAVHNPLLSPLARASLLYLLVRSGLAPHPLTAPTEGGDPEPLLDTWRWVGAGAPPPEERTSMLTVEKMLVLRGMPLFAGVREAVLLGVAASATEVRLLAGERLFDEGELGTSLYVIVTGELSVEVAGQQVALLGEREVVGEMAALDPEPRSARVSATRESLLLRLTDEDLDLLMGEDPDVARAIIQTLCRRLRSARSR